MWNPAVFKLIGRTQEIIFSDGSIIWNRHKIVTTNIEDEDMMIEELRRQKEWEEDHIFIQTVFWISKSMKINSLWYFIELKLELLKLSKKRVTAHYLNFDLIEHTDDNPIRIIKKSETDTLWHQHITIVNISHNSLIR